MAYGYGSDSEEYERIVGQYDLYVSDPPVIVDAWFDNNNVSCSDSESEADTAEHNFDEEWPLFVFDRIYISQLRSGMEISEMDHEETEKFLASISYAQVLGLAMKCKEMCDAWRLRRDKKILSDEDIERTGEDDIPTSEEDDLNLYQMDLNERQHVRDCSVYRLEKIVGDQREVEDFFKEITTSVNLLKSIIFMIIRSCLPPVIYSISPVIDLVLEHLIGSEGLARIGLVSTERSWQLVEVTNLIGLCEKLEIVYSCLRKIMFVPYLKVDDFLCSKYLRDHVHVMVKFLEEDTNLGVGGWASNPALEEDVGINVN